MVNAELCQTDFLGDSLWEWNTIVYYVQGGGNRILRIVNTTSRRNLKTKAPPFLQGIFIDSASAVSPPPVVSVPVRFASALLRGNGFRVAQASSR